MSNHWNLRKKIIRPVFTAALFVTCATSSLKAQGLTDYNRYIDSYKQLAIEQMMRYKIPASITLAQGLLESNAGKSELARRSNNHFGIKCGDWTGKTTHYDDDARQECFRVYPHVRDSYEDHSVFIAGRSRYASLFKLDITDYKGWAHGLRKCGYATNPNYGNLLINIIERYNLTQYDKMSAHKGIMKSAVAAHRPVYPNNDLFFVKAHTGDTFKSLSDELDISARKIRRYNDLPKDYTFKEGDVVYLSKKKTKANKAFKYHPAHVVKYGESMYSIAQSYGIRLKSLYKLNKMTPDHQVKVGDILRIY